jgi:small subunit ribosomal protein S1
MMTELVVGQNIGSLPDIFDELVNDNKKILKYKSKDLSSISLNDDYLFFLKKIEGEKNIDHLNVGDVVEGNVVEINKKDVIIDIFYKDNVYVDLKTLDSDLIETLKIGKPISVMITEINDDPYYIRGSVSEIIKMNVSNKVKEYFTENNFFYATVTELIPAGFMLNMEVDNSTVKAFMPNTLAWVNKLLDINSLLGKRIEVMIETLEQDKGIYVVSHKKYLESLIPSQIKKLKAEWVKNKLNPYIGFITGTTDFGAFVEFYGFLTGMIHRFNVNEEWQNDEKWSTMKPGMGVNFYIKDIIVPKNKIILTQILRKSLWDSIKVGQIINGKVIAIKSFGALIQLDEETNGLIQSNILTKHKVELKVGDTIEVKVLSLMKDDRKINLGLNK